MDNALTCQRAIVIGGGSGIGFGFDPRVRPRATGALVTIAGRAAAKLQIAIEMI